MENFKTQRLLTWSIFPNASSVFLEEAGAPAAGWSPLGSTTYDYS